MCIKTFELILSSLNVAAFILGHFRRYRLTFVNIRQIIINLVISVQMCYETVGDILIDLQIVVFAAFIAVASARRKPIEDIFADFAGEEDIHLITDEDDRPPTDFVGDVMKAKTTSLKTQSGGGKFNYKYGILSTNK